MLDKELDFLFLKSRANGYRNRSQLSNTEKRNNEFDGIGKEGYYLVAFFNSK